MLYYFLFDLVEYPLDKNIEDKMKSNLKSYVKILEEIDEFLVDYPNIEISEDVMEKLMERVQ